MPGDVVGGVKDHMVNNLYWKTWERSLNSSIKSNFVTEFIYCIKTYFFTKTA